ncbi:caspase family protein [Longispora sp. NPDC051575]|uniref:caspase, EACC1-associated type n=1 Tax=Longispora sp. NPDC051575 TaxID=3154943 RepID=UPI00341A1CD4
MGRRLALLIATYDYQDAGLRELASPPHDAEALAAVLGDPEIGGFEVTTLINESHHTVTRAVTALYDQLSRDDLPLLYFAGHGIKEADGRLHLALAGTRRENLDSTALPMESISHLMDRCISRQKVLIFDCCFGGQFPASSTTSNSEPPMRWSLGRGATILNASDTVQYVFEGDIVHGSATPSTLTAHLVAGLRDSSADLDDDGDITLDELSRYVNDRMAAENQNQRPNKWGTAHFRTVIGRNPHWRLPNHLVASITSPLTSVRLAALDSLERLNDVGNEIVRARVRETLLHLAEDDSRAVAEVAAVLLAPPAPDLAAAEDALRHARAEAQKILDEAKSQAADILTDAADNAKAIIASARQDAEESQRTARADTARLTREASRAEDRRDSAVAGAEAAETRRDAALAAATDAEARRDAAVAAMDAADSLRVTALTVVSAAEIRRDMVRAESEKEEQRRDLALAVAEAAELRAARVQSELPQSAQADESRQLAAEKGQAGTELTAQPGETAQPTDPPATARTRETTGPTAPTLDTVGSLTGHTKTVHSIAFHPNGHLLATASEDNYVRLWDPDNRTPAGLLDHSVPVYAVAFHPQGELLATGSQDNKVRLWDVSSGKRIGERLVGHSKAVYALAFHPEGILLASGSFDGDVRLWEPLSGRASGAVLTGHRQAVYAVAFSPDGKLLASGSRDRQVRFWNPFTNLEAGSPLTGHTGPVHAVAFHPGGRLLATAGEDATVRLWDLRTHQLVGRPLNGHTGTVHSVAFHPGGELMATAGYDCTVRLWNPRNGQPVSGPLTGHTGPVHAVAFHPDGHLLVSGSTTSAVRLWSGALLRHVDPVPQRFAPDSATVLLSSPDPETAEAIGKLLAALRFEEPRRDAGSRSSGPLDCVPASEVDHLVKLLMRYVTDPQALLSILASNEASKLPRLGTRQKRSTDNLNYVLSGDGYLRTAVATYLMSVENAVRALAAVKP